MRVLVSVTQRDGAELRQFLTDPLMRLAEALRRQGLTVETRLATQADLDQLGSSWGRRLGIPHNRAAWLLTAYSIRKTG